MPPVYVGISSEGELAAFWEKDDKTVKFFTPKGLWEKYFEAVLPNVDFAEEQKDSKESSKPDIVEFARNRLGLKNIYLDKSAVSITSTKPGTYYPRVWRGIYRGPGLTMGYIPIDPFKLYRDVILQSIIAAESLFSSFRDICRYVEPAERNLDTFSHRIRELLILACTEIEASWRGILDSNGYNIRASYSTTDYVKLNKLMRLQEWAVRLADYPAMGVLLPFKDWDTAKPTRSLRWYDEYNSVKHNRETEFSRASFRNALDATAALFVMQCAQWGPEVYDRWHFGRSAPLFVSSCPLYGAADVYIPPLDGSETMTPSNLLIG